MSSTLSYFMCPATGSSMSMYLFTTLFRICKQAQFFSWNDALHCSLESCIIMHVTGEHSGLDKLLLLWMDVLFNSIDLLQSHKGLLIVPLMVRESNCLVSRSNSCSKKWGKGCPI